MLPSTAISTSPIKKTLAVPAHGTRIALPKITKKNVALTPIQNIGRFTESQLVKYKEWFNQIDANRSGSVDIKELSNVLIGAGVVRNRREARAIFNDMDINGNGSISLGEFLTVVADSEAKKRMQVKRLDEFIESESLLDTETLLSLERRQIIMQQVVHKTQLRASDIDWIQTMGTYGEFLNSRDDRLHMQETHRLEREASNRVLSQMKVALEKAKAKNVDVDGKAVHKVKKVPSCLVADIEAMLPPSLRSSPTGSEEFGDMAVSVECLAHLHGEDDMSSGVDSAVHIESQSGTTALHAIVPSPAAGVELSSPFEKPSPVRSLPRTMCRSLSESDTDRDRDTHRLVMSHIGCREEFPSRSASLQSSPNVSRRNSRVNELLHHQANRGAGTISYSPIQFRKKKLGTVVLSDKRHCI